MCMSLCVSVPCGLVMASIQWQTASFGAEGFTHTHKHTHPSQFKTVWQWSQSFQLNHTHGLHRKPTGIEDRFIEVLLCGTQKVIVWLPGTALFLSCIPLQPKIKLTWRDVSLSVRHLKQHQNFCLHSFRSRQINRVVWHFKELVSNEDELLKQRIIIKRKNLQKLLFCSYFSCRFSWQDLRPK